MLHKQCLKPGVVTTGGAHAVVLDNERRPITAGRFVDSGPIVLQDISEKAGLTAGDKSAWNRYPVHGDTLKNRRRFGLPIEEFLSNRCEQCHGAQLGGIAWQTPIR